LSAYRETVRTRFSIEGELVAFSRSSGRFRQARFCVNSAGSGVRVSEFCRFVVGVSDVRLAVLGELKMKLLRKKTLRWQRAFRAPNPADLLLLYAGSMPRFDSALWHSHSRNHFPHAHVQARASTEEHAQQRHRHDHDDKDHEHSDFHRNDHEMGDSTHGRDDSGDNGHWHFVVPAELLRISYPLLVLALCDAWILIRGLASCAPGWRSAHSARAPPLFVALP
jgi:hypothetical protein